MQHIMDPSDITDTAEYGEQQENMTMVEDTQQPAEEATTQVTAAEAEESAIPTPSESAESGTPPSALPENSALAEVSSPSPHQKEGTPSQQQPQAPPKPSTAVPRQPLKKRPRRTGQPLHLLLQDCSKQHISGSLSKKTPEEIKAIVSDRKALANDLRTFSNDFVLTSARDRVIVEVEEEGKELLTDVDPERDVIKQRFEDERSVFKSYEDAIHDIRVDLYLEGIKPRKQESEEDSSESSSRNQELNTVLEIWDTIHKRTEIEPKRAGRATQSPYPSRGGRPAGSPVARPHPYAGYRSPGPGPGSVPPQYSPPFAGPPAMSGPPLRDSRSHHRGYERPPYREEYYPDRRDDYRRPDYDRRDPRDHPMGMRPPPPGPGPMGRPDPRDMRDARDPREFRDRPPPPAARNDGAYGTPGGASRYEDRRRDRPDISNAPPPRDSRHSGPNGAAASPLVAHPSLPPKPHGTHFDSAPASQVQHQAAGVMYPQHYPSAPHHQQQAAHMDPQGAHAAYGAYGQPQAYSLPGQADYSGYAYAGYGQDAETIAAQQAYAYSAAAAGAGWDISGAAAGVASLTATGLHLLPFSSNQPGRHKAVPLPTDFMSGPSDAPRLSMPEPHEVLGRIQGVIIRDAQGNIGLCQYQFTQAT